MKLYYFLVFLFFHNNLIAQNDPIHLRNASIEDRPYASHWSTPNLAPFGWRNCGFSGESPPDVQPNLELEYTDFFGVTTAAFDGDTYLGMVAKEKGKWESLGQALKQPLQANQCYAMSVYLSLSEIYEMPTRGFKKELVNHDQPCVLRIWGGNASCAKTVLLATSPPIDHYDWRRYTFSFQSKEKLHFFYIEAYYSTSKLEPYNGNILVDNFSPIYPIDCKQLGDTPLLIDQSTLFPGMAKLDFETRIQHLGNQIYFDYEDPYILASESQIYLKALLETAANEERFQIIFDFPKDEQAEEQIEMIQDYMDEWDYDLAFIDMLYGQELADNEYWLCYNQDFTIRIEKK